MTKLQRWRKTLGLRWWTFWRIRMISYVRPTVVDSSEDRCEIRLPLSRRTRNHLNSMYLGALCTGADAAAALIGLDILRRSGKRFSFVFKDLHAEFLKRPEADVHFVCEQGREIAELLERAGASGERENLSLLVTATVPSVFGAEPVARFALTLSVKRRD